MRGGARLHSRGRTAQSFQGQGRHVHIPQRTSLSVASSSGRHANMGGNRGGFVRATDASSYCKTYEGVPSMYGEYQACMGERQRQHRLADWQINRQIGDRVD